MTRKTDAGKKLLAPLMVSLAICAAAGMNLSARAIETSPAATTAASGDSVLEPNNKTNDKERKEIEALLSSLETQWNAHDLDGVMSHYSEDYVNNDGLDKKAVASITKKFWSQYPDSKSSSKIKQVRIDGNFSTIESRDVASGTTERENADTGTKGELNSVSEGQVYLKKNGNNWKIIGDRIDYEKVRVSYGLARQLTANFSAPEQVKSGRQYSARVDISLPVGLTAIGSIMSQPLKYPQKADAAGEPKPRIIDGESLERVMSANTDNRNELLMATVGITNATRSHLMGITVVTRRLNVIPQTVDADEKTDIATRSEEDTQKNKADAKTEADNDKTGDASESGKSKSEEPGKGEKSQTTSTQEKKTETKTESSKSSKSKDKPKSEKKQNKSSTDGDKKKDGADSQ
ncbi:MAG: nuclear transport factor 2 family protein [Candidatus Melainabacteria bacterium]|nr:nuclear transport factor 2 family protein [Candidatus Melainabacteria bacterium]